MSYYGYHQKIKQRIRNGELVDCYIDQNYPKIGTALVLAFGRAPFKRPIWTYRWGEYLPMLRKEMQRCPGVAKILTCMTQFCAL